jgi:hypothetical protein
MPRRNAPRFTGGFGGFWSAPIGTLPEPDLPPLGDYEAPTVPQPSLTVYPGGGRAPSIHTTPPEFPTVNPSTNVTIDPSGAGFASPGLRPGSWPSRQHDIFVEQNQPQDISTGGASVAGGIRSPAIPSPGGDSPSFVTDPNQDWVGTNQQPATDSVFMDTSDHPYIGTGLQPFVPQQDAGTSTASSSATPIPGPSFTPGSERFSPGLSPHPSAGIIPNYPRHDIANFGGSMTLGQFLNTPLALMRFNTDHWQPGAQPSGTAVAGGKPPDLQPGEAYIDPQTSVTPSDAVPSPDAPTSTLSDPGSGAPPPTQSTPQQQSRQPVANQPSQLAAQPSSRLNQILQTFPSLNNPAAIRAINSGASPIDLVGHAQFDSHAAGLMEMGFQSFGGNPNETGNTSDEGHNIFTSNTASLNPEGGFDVTSGRAASNPAQYAMYQAALKAVPIAPYGGFNTNYVKALNDWIASQGQSPSNNLYSQATSGRKSPTRPAPSMTPTK